MVSAALGILGAIGAIVGIVAFVDARTSRRVKRLVWESTTPVPVAAAVKEPGDYKLSILYERPGTKPQVVNSADVAYIRFANLGKEPIRRVDIAPASTFRLVVEHKESGVGHPLDVAISATSRDVVKVALGTQVQSDTETSVDVTFDFLDFADGGVIRLLTNGPPASIKMKGDIVGMPQGLQAWEPAVTSVELRGWGVAAWGAVEAVAFAGLGFLFREVTGGWSGVWLLLLPPFVFFGVLIGCLLAAEGPSAYKRRRLRFPTTLDVPGRFAFGTRFGPDGEYELRPMPRPPKRTITPADTTPAEGQAPKR